MYTVATHVGHSNSGESYSTTIVAADGFYDFYQRTTCGFLRPNFATMAEAEAAADEWLTERRSAPYSGRD